MKLCFAHAENKTELVHYINFTISPI